MSNNRIVIIPKKLIIFRRKESPVWFSEIWIDGVRKSRKTTKTTDKKIAERIASDHYEETLGRHSKGLSTTGSSIPKLIKKYISKRKKDVENKEFDAKNFEQVVQVLNEYFLVWVEENNFKHLDDIGDVEFYGEENPKSYLNFRHEIPLKRREHDTHTYERDGKEITIPMPKHFTKVPKFATLKKQIQPIRGLYKYAHSNNFINKVPSFLPIQKKRNEALEHAKLDVYESTPDNQTGWLEKHEMIALLKASQDKCDQLIESSLNKKPQPHFTTKTTVLEYALVSKRAVEALMCKAYILIAIGTGLRPCGIHRILWQHIKEIDVGGESTLEITVYEKGKGRTITTNPELLSIFKNLARYTQDGKTFEEVIASKELRSQPIIPVKNFVQQIKGLYKKAGLSGRGFHRYTFRHTYINQQLLDGRTALEVSIECGNSVETISKHYLKLSPRVMAEERARKENEEQKLRAEIKKQILEEMQHS